MNKVVREVCQTLLSVLTHDRQKELYPRASNFVSYCSIYLTKINTVLKKKPLYIHLVTTMLATSDNVLFPGHNTMLTTGTVVPLTNYNPRLGIKAWWLPGA